MLNMPLYRIHKFVCDTEQSCWKMPKMPQCLCIKYWSFLHTELSYFIMYALCTDAKAFQLIDCHDSESPAKQLWTHWREVCASTLSWVQGARIFPPESHLIRHGLQVGLVNGEGYPSWVPTPQAPSQSRTKACRLKLSISGLLEVRS